MNDKNLNELLEANRYAELMRTLDEINAVDAAEFLASLDTSLQAKLFRLLKKDTASDIFTELESDVQEAIIRSMTVQERENPDIISSSRRKRIAAGSGTSVEDVNKLLKQFEQTNKLMKQISSGKGIPGLGGFGGFGNRFTKKKIKKNKKKKK